MKLHANARTCPNSRQVMVRRLLAGRPREILAAEFAVSTRTVSKWVARYRAEGEAGLVDRSSAPRRVSRTDPDRVAAIAAFAPAGHRMTGSRASQKRTRVNGRLTGVAGWEFVHVCVDDATRLAYALFS